MTTHELAVSLNAVISESWTYFEEMSWQSDRFRNRAKKEHVEYWATERRCSADRSRFNAHRGSATYRGLPSTGITCEAKSRMTSTSC
ncbi:hypothetical protein PC121_g5393 [Phytophthora cactorum]|nr:hypothetical protein PC121_g5393 [Phytophthora cactorum]